MTRAHNAAAYKPFRPWRVSDSRQNLATACAHECPAMPQIGPWRGERSGYLPACRAFGRVQARSRRLPRLIMAPAFEFIPFAIPLALALIAFGLLIYLDKDKQ